MTPWPGKTWVQRDCSLLSSSPCSSFFFVHRLQLPAEWRCFGAHVPKVASVLVGVFVPDHRNGSVKSGYRDWIFHNNGNMNHLAVRLSKTLAILQPLLGCWGYRWPRKDHHGDRRSRQLPGRPGLLLRRGPERTGNRTQDGKGLRKGKFVEVCGGRGGLFPGDAESLWID